MIIEGWLTGYPGLYANSLRCCERRFHLKLSFGLTITEIELFPHNFDWQ